VFLFVSVRAFPSCPQRLGCYSDQMHVDWFITLVYITNVIVFLIVQNNKFTFVCFRERSPTPPGSAPGLWRLVSYKLALHVLATFTEQVVPIQKHITLFWIPSISGTKIVTNETNAKGRGEVIKAEVKLSDHTHITFYWIPHWPCVIWKMASGDLFHT